MIKLWERVSSRFCGDFAVFSIREDQSRSPRTGHVSPFYVLESVDWVNCLPVTEDGRLVCVRQFRHGTRSVMLEIPGGLVNDGEEPAVAARREMCEETGFDAKELVHLGSMRPNPAILNNTCHFYLGRSAAYRGAQRLDSGEDIEVVLVDLEDLAGLVRAGEFTHGISLAGLFYLDLYLRGM